MGKPFQKLPPLSSAHTTFQTPVPGFHLPFSLEPSTFHPPPPRTINTHPYRNRFTCQPRRVQLKQVSNNCSVSLFSRFFSDQVSTMASQFGLRRIGSSLLSGNNLHRPIRSLSVAPWCSSRSFNTNAQMTRMDDHDDEREIGIDRRSDRFPSRRGDMPAFFSDVFDPFSPTRSVSQLMNMMDQLMDFPFAAGTGGTGGVGGARRGWDAKEDENALYLRMDMPGLGREDVKVSVEENTLTIRGEQGDEASEEDKRRYSTRIDLTPNLYKVDGIKAEMKNGVLKVVVPKVKEEERKDVFQVQVE